MIGPGGGDRSATAVIGLAAIGPTASRRHPTRRIPRPSRIPRPRRRDRPAPRIRRASSAADPGPTPSAATAAPVEPAEPPAAASGAGLDAAAVRRVWPEVLAAAKERKKRTAALLVSATVRAVDGDTLVLSIGTAPLARLLSEQSNTEVLAESLHAVLGVRWRIRCEHGEPGAGPVPAPARGAPAPPAAAPQRPSRPPPVRRSTAPEDGVPLPPEPADEDAPPDDEEAMLAEAAAGVSAPPGERRDPEELAIELLSAQLGARAIDRS